LNELYFFSGNSAIGRWFARTQSFKRLARTTVDIKLTVHPVILNYLYNFMHVTPQDTLRVVTI